MNARKLHPPASYPIGITNNRTSMMRTTVLLFALLLGLASAHAVAQGLDGSRSREGGIIAFTENRGQIIDDEGRARHDLLYSASANGAGIYFARDRICYLFARMEDNGRSHRSEHGSDGASHRHCERELPVTTRLYRTDLEFIGASRATRVTAEERAPGVTNYYLPHAPTGILGVASWRRIIYHDLYPSIDMVVIGTGRGIEYDFIVHPGGDPARIRMRAHGARSSRVSDSGALRITSPLGYLEQSSPFTYQIDPITFERRVVASSYRIDRGVITVDVGGYDPTRTLVIDPPQEWATFYGGTLAETQYSRHACAVDRSGNAAIAGQSLSLNFPTQAATQVASGGNFDVVIAKFDVNGNPIFSTYFGGSGDEYAHGVAVDGAGNVLACGHSYSTNAPVPNAFQSTNLGMKDGFVMKLTSAGALAWATYAGTTFEDDAWGIAADAAGNPVVILSTGGAAFGGGAIDYRRNRPTPVGNTILALDIAILKYTPNGSLTWCAFYGGRMDDNPFGVATDSRGNIAITGWTSSPDFPVTPGLGRPLNGVVDAIVLKVDSEGSRVWSALLGGSGIENPPDNGVESGSVACDAQDNVIVTGTVSTAAQFPITPGAPWPTALGGRDIFIVKYNAAGTILYSTFFGTRTDDFGASVCTSPSGEIFVAGCTYGNDLPTLRAGQQAPFQAFAAGSTEGFIVQLTNGGLPAWVTYVGGGGFEELNGIGYDNNGAIVVCGTTTTGTDVPFALRSRYQAAHGEPIAQPLNSGVPDLFITRFCMRAPADIDSTIVDPFCPGNVRRFWTEQPEGAVRWYRVGNPHQFVSDRDTLEVHDPGTYFAEIDRGTNCTLISRMVKVTFPPAIDLRIAPNPATICTGESVLLTASHGRLRSYAWVTPAGDTVSRAPSYTAGSGGTYTLFVVDTTGCPDTALVTIQEKPKPAAVTAQASDTVICEGQLVQLSVQGGSGGRLEWHVDGVPASLGSASTLTVKSQGIYYATSTSTNGCVSTSNRVRVTVHRAPRPLLLPRRAPPYCLGDTVALDVTATPFDAASASGLYRSYRWSTGDSTPSIIAVAGAPVNLTVTDTNGCTATVTFSPRIDSLPRPLLRATPGASICDGGVVTIDAGKGFREYLWSNGETGSQISVRDSGAYWVTVRAASGCIGRSDTVHVHVGRRPDATISGPSVICINTKAQYSVPDVPGTAYSWKLVGSTGSIDGAATGALITIDWGNAANADVIVRAVDTASGCASDDTLFVTVGSQVIPSIVGKSRFCAGDSVTLDAGPGFVRYQWSTGDTSRTIVMKIPGTVTVSVHTATGCSGTSDPFEVSVAPPVAARIAADGPVELCSGDSVTLRAAPVGDDYRYRWSNGATVEAIRVSTSGSYYLTVTDSSGCSGMDSIVVNVHPYPTPVVSGPDSICVGRIARYTTAPIDGGSYTWRIASGDGVIKSGEGTNAIDLLWSAAGSGVVELSVADDIGCSGASLPFAVTIHRLPIVRGITQQGMRLTADVDTINGPRIASYRWLHDNTPLAGAESSSIDAAIDGDYMLRVTSVDGCDAEYGPMHAEGNASSAVGLPAITAAPGEHVMIPIVLSASGNLDEVHAERFEATIRFDGGLLIPTEPVLANITNDSERIVTIAGRRPAGMTAGVIDSLECLVLLGDTIETALRLDELRWLDATSTVQVTRSDGHFTLIDICVTGGPRLLVVSGVAGLKSVRPNPASGICEIEYEVVEHGPTHLALVDAYGHELALLVAGDADPGGYIATLDARRLPSGAYFVVLRTPTERFVRVMEVVR